jgi:hypothetical protein
MKSPVCSAQRAIVDLGIRLEQRTYSSKAASAAASTENRHYKNQFRLRIVIIRIIKSSVEMHHLHKIPSWNDHPQQYIPCIPWRQSFIVVIFEQEKRARK